MMPLLSIAPPACEQRPRRGGPRAQHINVTTCMYVRLSDGEGKLVDNILPALASMRTVVHGCYRRTIR